MAIPHSTSPVVHPMHSGTASFSAHAAVGRKNNAAEELLHAYRNASHIVGRLPTLAELPRTIFSVNPRNRTQGTIAFLHPDDPLRVTGKCFLRSHRREALDDIEAKFDAYSKVSYPPGEAPLEVVPLEVFRHIVGNLWGELDPANDNADVKSLCRVSSTIRCRLLDVQKVVIIEVRFASLVSIPAVEVNGQFARIANYALSDKPVILVSASLLVAFKHVVQAYIARSRDISTSAMMDFAIQFIERMKSDHDASAALSILDACPAVIFKSFMLAFSEEDEFERAEKLVGIVTRMKDADAKAVGIAVVGNLLRLSGPMGRPKIGYVAPLLALAESLDVEDEAMDRIGHAFLNVRVHLARYCAVHYDASHEHHFLFHDPAEDTEENRNVDLETGRRLDAFLLRLGFGLPSIGGSEFASGIVPLWQTQAH